MKGKCIVSGCGNFASKYCGSCGWVRYCGVECQKGDWKQRHKKRECVNMKKLSSLSLSEGQIEDVSDKVSRISGRLSSVGETESNIDLLNECIAFARDRLSRLLLKDSPRLKIDILKLDSLIICRLLINLGDIYYNMTPSADIDNHAVSYTSEARELLMQRKNAGIYDMAMQQLIMRCDFALHNLYSRGNQLEKIKYHSAECVATARQYTGPGHVPHLITALSLLSTCLLTESNLPEALALGEEAYTVASKHYSPAHKTVLKASRKLIDCLIVMKDYSTADAYCRMNYANLNDPNNAEEYDPEDGVNVMSQLAKIWLLQEPDKDEIVAKALADEAIELSRKAYAASAESRTKGTEFNCLNTLCLMLLKTSSLTEETEGLMHQLVTACITETRPYYETMHDALLFFLSFYAKMNEAFPTGEKSSILKENVKSCQQLFVELDSCVNDTIGLKNCLDKMKPYFDSNVELFRSTLINFRLDSF